MMKSVNRYKKFKEFKNQNLKKKNLIQYQKDNSIIDKDGLNTCKFKVLKKKKLENNIYRYLIDI